MPPAPLVLRRAPRRAFTLIELLTVIAIIGILAAILIPTVARVRASARASQCVSNLRQIVVSLRLYAEDNKGYLPEASRAKRADETGSGTTITWGKALRPYLPLIGNTSTSREHPIFVCGAADYDGKSGNELGTTYSCTAAMLGNLGRTAMLPRALSTIDTYRLTQIPLLVEGKADSAGATSARSNLSWTFVSPDFAAAGPDSTVRLDFRHSSRMNLAYVDGSVRSSDFTAVRAIDRPTWEGLAPSS